MIFTLSGEIERPGVYEAPAGIPLETLFHEVTAKRELERSFEDMRNEIEHLVSQLSDEERSAYLAESLFLNQVTYENDKLESYMRKLEKK